MRASLEGGAYAAQLLAHPEVVAIPERQLTSGQVLVAEAEGRVLGFAAVELGPEGVAELDGLFVEPRAWRGGLGRALVEACEALVRRRGAGVMTVVANPGAEGFYLRCGFVGQGPVETQFGPAIAMRKPLGGRS